jgi:hypothetical protein
VAAGAVHSRVAATANTYMVVLSGKEATKLAWVIKGMLYSVTYLHGESFGRLLAAGAVCVLALPGSEYHHGEC